MIFLVGIVAGFGAIFFKLLIAFFHNLLFYGELSTHYNVLAHAAPSRFGVFIIFIPVIGAFFVAYLVKNYAPEAKGHGVPEVMDAIYYEQGKVRPIVALIKSLASSLSIGSGGSIGREGPIIQIGAAFGSTIGQAIKVPDWQRITLIACGAGGGIAATFNTPLGGILFALEIMLPEFSARTILPVTFATAVATYTSYLFAGNVPFIPFQAHILSNVTYLQIMMYLIFGAGLGLVSAFFIHVIYWFEDFFDAIPGNYYVRHLSGMFLVGITIYLMLRFFGHYYVQGVGYATVMDVLSLSLLNPYFLLFLAMVKLFVTAITLGSGGSGGIFSPLLFIGATLGAAIAILTQQLLPVDASIGIQLGALAGMAALVGASTGAPITGIIMTAELTMDFDIILPLMLIVTSAALVRKWLMQDTVYTLKLTRRGHIIPDAMVKSAGIM